MSVLKCKTKGNESAKGLSAIFFCCHPSDFSRYFTEISDELLRLHRCAIFYADPKTPRDQAFWNDVKEMDLFVVPITSELLCAECDAVRTEIPFAIKNGIPVLPLMQERNLVEDFNRCSVFRNRQYLDKYNTDATALPYEEKLKNYLQRHLVSDDEAKRIRDAFDGRIFLSYRKKDRRYAQDLMRLVHQNDFCRDLAIWYDEYLTPGEDFNAGIESELLKSDLFLLTVTPSILEYTSDENGNPQKNYVAREEYPCADKAGIPIAPIQMVATDAAALDAFFEATLHCTDAQDTSALRQVLRNKLDVTKLRQNDHDPVHNYLIGLAYLYGVDLEKNSATAIKLITSASDAGLIEATEKLVDIYHRGIGVNIDVAATFNRQALLITQYQQAYLANPCEDTLNAWFWAAITLGDFYAELDKQHAARAQYANASNIALSAKALAAHPLFLHLGSVIDERMGDSFCKQNDFDKATQHYQSCLSLRRQIYDIEDTVYNRQCVALAYERLGDICCHNRQYDEAIENFEKKLELDRQLCAEGGSVDDLLALFNGLYKLAKTHLDNCLMMKCDPSGALEKAAKYGAEAFAMADSFVTANDSPLALHRQSAICTLMGKILFNDADFKMATGTSAEDCADLLDEAEALHQKGLVIAKRLYDTQEQNLHSTERLIAAYRALGDLCQARTSEIINFDYNKKDRIDDDTLVLLERDRELVESARTYYNKALDLAHTLYRNYKTHSVTQLLYHCQMDVSMILAHLSRLPQPPKLYKSLKKQVVAHYEDALELAQQIFRNNPIGVHREQIAHIFIRLATLGETEKRKYLPEAIHIYKELAKADPACETYANNLHALQAMLENKPCIFNLV